MCAYGEFARSRPNRGSNGAESRMLLSLALLFVVAVPKLTADVLSDKAPFASDRGMLSSVSPAPSGASSSPPAAYDKSAARSSVVFEGVARGWGIKLTVGGSVEELTLWHSVTNGRSAAGGTWWGGSIVIIPSSADNESIAYHEEGREGGT